MILKLRALVWIAILTATSRAGLPADASGGWQTYQSPDYGFTVDHPANMTFHPGHPDYKEITLLSFIPICDDTTVACFAYNGNEYKGTNFGGAGLSVNVLRDKKTEKDCNQIDTGSYPVKTVTINGTKFHYGFTGDVATSHSEGGPSYRAFHQNVCFEVAAGVAATSIGAYEPGTIKTFDSRKLDHLLDKMVHTFRFTGAVTDGPAWKVHRDPGCGGLFEYPESDEVITTIEYSQARFASNEITCSGYFTDHGLDYTLAAKVNLKDKNGFETWLKSSGYPELVNARVAASSKYYTQYNAESFYYIFGQGTVYILSVSDAKHNVIAPNGDPVFKHFLNSFKAN
ncbi:MAG TPA: hypothetical protein VK763_01160 [Terriglobales bacterium]|jgi:hypothetical protein|nr:hypothetical protein [Terriglobales bacterium]